MESKTLDLLEKLIYLVIVNSLAVVVVVLFGDSQLTSAELAWLAVRTVVYVTLVAVGSYLLRKRLGRRGL